MLRCTRMLHVVRCTLRSPLCVTQGQLSTDDQICFGKAGEQTCWPRVLFFIGVAGTALSLESGSPPQHLQTLLGYSRGTGALYCSAVRPRRTCVAPTVLLDEGQGHLCSVDCCRTRALTHVGKRLQRTRVLTHARGTQARVDRWHGYRWATLAGSSLLFGACDTATSSARRSGSSATTW
jgi:hypothetical protein